MLVIVHFHSMNISIWLISSCQLELGETSTISSHELVQAIVSTPLGGLDSKESTLNAGDLDLIPVLERFPEGGHGSPLLYSCLENPMDRGAWWATVHGVTKSQTQLSD